MTNIKVAVRVRPMSNREGNVSSVKSVVKTEPNNVVSVTNLKVPEHHAGDSRERIRRFAFDYCFGPEVSQTQVYKTLGSSLLEAVSKRFNVCVLAYGQSATGKTHTMMGTQNDPGITPRLCQGLFDEWKKNNREFRARLSFLEIYNEKVQDLLAVAPDANDKSVQSLRVREHPKNGPYVQDLSEVEVNDADSLLRYVKRGDSLRRVAATHSNRRSSRSHAVLTVSLSNNDNTIHDSATDFKETDATGNAQVTLGNSVTKIQLVDLAGSERASSVPSSLCRQKEGANINRSLVALGNVISALAENSILSIDEAENRKCIDGEKGGVRNTWKNTQRYVAYRDSVLTWLLKDTLGGNSKTIMIATVSPSSSCYSETVNTLRFGQRAKTIVNQPIVNEEPHTRVIRELREEIIRLRELIDKQQKCKMIEIGSSRDSSPSNNKVTKNNKIDEDAFETNDPLHSFSGKTSSMPTSRRNSQITTDAKVIVTKEKLIPIINVSTSVSKYVPSPCMRRASSVFELRQCKSPASRRLRFGSQETLAISPPPTQQHQQAITSIDELKEGERISILKTNSCDVVLDETCDLIKDNNRVNSDDRVQHESRSNSYFSSDVKSDCNKKDIRDCLDAEKTFILNALRENNESNKNNDESLADISNRNVSNKIDLLSLGITNTKNQTSTQTDKTTSQSVLVQTKLSEIESISTQTDTLFSNVIATQTYETSKEELPIKKEDISCSTSLRSYNDDENKTGDKEIQTSDNETTTGTPARLSQASIKDAIRKHNLHRRSEIVASVTERLYAQATATMAKKKSYALDNQLSNRDIMDSASITNRSSSSSLASEISICSNARNRLQELSFRALSASRRSKKPATVGAETQTHPASTLRVKDAAIDIQHDIKAVTILVKDASTDSMPTPSLRDASTGPSSATSTSTSTSTSTTTSPSTKMTLSSHLTDIHNHRVDKNSLIVTRSCSSMTDEEAEITKPNTIRKIYDDQSSNRLLSDAGFVRNKPISFTKYITHTTQASQPETIEFSIPHFDPAAYSTSVNINFNCNLSEGQTKSEDSSLSDDSLDASLQSSGVVAQNVCSRTPDLISNHNSLENNLHVVCPTPKPFVTDKDQVSYKNKNDIQLKFIKYAKEIFLIEYFFFIPEINYVKAEGCLARTVYHTSLHDDTVIVSQALSFISNSLFTNLSKVKNDQCETSKVSHIKSSGDYANDFSDDESQTVLPRTTGLFSNRNSDKLNDLKNIIRGRNANTCPFDANVTKLYTEDVKKKANCSLDNKTKKSVSWPDATVANVPLAIVIPTNEPYINSIMRRGTLSNISASTETPAREQKLINNEYSALAPNLPSNSRTVTEQNGNELVKSMTAFLGEATSLMYSMNTIAQHVQDKKVLGVNYNVFETKLKNNTDGNKTNVITDSDFDLSGCNLSERRSVGAAITNGGNKSTYRDANETADKYLTVPKNKYDDVLVESCARLENCIRRCEMTNSRTYPRYTPSYTSSGGPRTRQSAGTSPLAASSSIGSDRNTNMKIPQGGQHMQQHYHSYSCPTGYGEVAAPTPNNGCDIRSATLSYPSCSRLRTRPPGRFPTDSRAESVNPTTFRYMKKYRASSPKAYLMELTNARRRVIEATRNEMNDG